MKHNPFRGCSAPIDTAAQDASEAVLGKKGIAAVIEDWKTIPSPGRFYAKQKVTRENIGQLEFTLLTSKEVDDYVSEGNQIIPEQLAGQGFFSWLDSSMVQGIIENQFEYKPGANEQEVIEAIFYYLDNDTFMHV